MGIFFQTRISASIVALMLVMAANKLVSAATLEEQIENIRLTHGIAAAAYFIVGPSSIEALTALGHSDWHSRAEFDVDHLVRIGSITKAFTALATTILVERGELSFDTRVSAIVDPPPYLNPWAETHPVTTGQLLEHSAGLKDLSSREFAFDKPLSLADAFELDPQSRHLAWPAGYYSSYSNSGAGILSAVIERLTGLEYAEFVRNEVFVPLGMQSARFSFEDEQRNGLITGYNSDARTVIPYWHTLYPAFGGISVATREMIPFVQLFLNQGRHGNGSLITKAAIERMQQPTTTLAARAGLTYGYGLGIYQFQRQGVSFYGHGGDADGYLSFFAYSPRLGKGYFVVINAFIKPALSAMRRAIEDEMIAQTAQASYPETVSLNQGQIRLLTGTYAEVTQRFPRAAERRTLVVHEQNNTLWSTIGTGEPRALHAVTQWHFRRRHQTVATIAFIPCGDRIFLQGDFGNYEKQPTRNRPAVQCAGRSD